MNTIQTRKVTLSNRKLNNIGKDYQDTFLGLDAVFTSFNGERTVGTITHFKTIAFHVSHSQMALGHDLISPLN